MESLGTQKLTDLENYKGALPVGTILQQRYQILSIIGSGGMSMIYKARDLRFEKTSRICAVKEMHNTIQDPGLRELCRQHFDREANLLASLSHHAVLKVFDYFSEGDGVFLVMDFIEGRDLGKVIEESTTPIPQEKVIDWAIQVCEVLSYLHDHEPEPIMFRDLTPSNIMLTPHGKLILIDFGIAKRFQGEQRGTMIGTAGYPPPEQYRGAAEPRGDLYALGATMHHFLTKSDPRDEPPFTFHERPIRSLNPEVSEALEAIVMKALEYDIDKRWASAEEFKQALESLIAPSALADATSTVAFSTSALAFSQTGSVLPVWEFACEDEITSSPFLSDEVLYIGSYDHNLYAVDAREGKFIWKYPTEAGISGSPYVWEDFVLIGSEDHILRALSKDDGHIAWSSPTRDRIRSSPRVYMSHVFFGSDDHFLYNLDARNGRQVWKYEAMGHIRSSPSILEGLVYFGSDDGSVYAVDIQSGRQKWKCPANRPVLSSPLVYEGIVFFGSMDWNVYAVDAREGWVIWRYRTRNMVISSPAISESLGLVFVGSIDGSVYAIDYSKGREVWKYPTEGMVGSSPAVTGEAVYIGSSDGHLYSLDVRTGELRWKFDAGSGVVSNPTVWEDMVFVGARNGRVYALLL